MTPVLFKQWGLQRSGTNAVHELFSRNTTYPGLVSILGGKHHRISKGFGQWIEDNTGEDGYVRDYGKRTSWRACTLYRMLEEAHVIHLVSVRSPLSWLEAWSRYLEMKRPLPSNWIAEQLASYAERLDSWLNHSGDTSLFPFEDVCARPVSLMRNFFLKETLPFPDEWVVPAKALQPGDDIVPVEGDGDYTPPGLSPPSESFIQNDWRSSCSEEISKVDTSLEKAEKRFPFPDTFDLNYKNWRLR